MYDTQLLLVPVRCQIRSQFGQLKDVARVTE